MLEPIKNVYYFFEDIYYSILDRIDPIVPVYKVIDPIDDIFPSFILFIILFLLALLLGVFLVVGGGNPIALLLQYFGGGEGAKFSVVDKDDTPLSGILVDFSLDGKTESQTTDSFGEFTSKFFGKGVRVHVKAYKYTEFSDSLDIDPGMEYTIKLNPEKKPVSVKTINFEIRDDQRSPLTSSDEVSMSFSCSASSVAPAQFTRRGASQSVSVQTDCGMLNASIYVAGFEDEKRQVFVSSQEGTVVVILTRKESLADVLVRVRDFDSGSPIADAAIIFKRGDVIALDAGLTDEEGSLLVHNVPAGSYNAQATAPEALHYSTGFSDEFSLGSAEFDSSGPVEVTVLLKKSADPSKVIYLKFVDSVSNTPISGVRATLVKAGKVLFPLESGDDGTVKFTNLDINKYSVVADHADYLLKVVKDVNMISGSSPPTVVKLVKLPSPTAGSAKVIVSEYSGTKVSGADVALYTDEFGFPLKSGTSGSDGSITFTGLPVGQYFAKAEKIIGGVLKIANSEKKQISAGATTEFQITLVIATGKIDAEVVDDAGVKIADADVNFMNGTSLIGKKKTNSSGKTDELEVSQEKRPHIVVAKAGFKTATSIDYTITPGTPVHAKVALERIVTPDPIAPFNVSLLAVTNMAGAPVNVVTAGNSYKFRFRLSVADAATNIKFVARPGPEGELNSTDSNFVIRSFNPTGASYYPCYVADNNYVGGTRPTPT